MVFRTGSGSIPEAASYNNTAPGVDAAMASGSASSTAISKSPQPLHNFTIPDNLKWSFTQSPHRFRKLVLTDSASPQRSSSGNPDAVIRPPVDAAALGVSDKKRKMVVVCDRVQDRSQVGNADEEVSLERKSNKILLRLSNKGKAGGEARAGEAAESPVAVAAAVNVEDQNQTTGNVAAGDYESDAEEAARKTWNFRPRKPLVKKQPPVVANVPKGERVGPEAKQSQGQSQGKGNNVKKKKEDKQELSVSLSRQEIEEDIFVMTGSRPCRRPKKRPKAVQKLLDNVFPGLWLYSISPDDYRVPDPPLKN